MCTQSDLDNESTQSDLDNESSALPISSSFILCLKETYRNPDTAREEIV